MLKHCHNISNKISKNSPLLSHLFKSSKEAPPTFKNHRNKSELQSTRAQTFFSNMSEGYKLPVSEYLNKHSLQKLIEDAVNQCYKAQSTNPTAYLV